MFSVYIDEDALQRSVVAALRSAGFDCLTATEARMGGRSDDEQLGFAASQHRVLFTKNAGDFQKLNSVWLSTGRHHAGIIVLTDSRAAVGVQKRAFEAMGTRFTNDDMKDRIEFLLNYRVQG